MTRIPTAISLLLIVSGGSVAYPQPSIQTGSLAESHIRANVPDEKDFDRFLKRDLERYFGDSGGKGVVVEDELLRSEVTQTGIAFPKFYVWVRLFEKGTLLDEGAVRLAAIDKKRFEITDYLPKSAMRSNPQKTYEVFPRAIADKITEKLNR